MLRHVIMSATYGTVATGEAIPSADFSSAFEEVTKANGVDPIACVSYTSAYQVNPVEAGLKDAWINLSTDDRKRIKEMYPELFQSIFLLLTGSTPVVEETLRMVRDGN